MENMRLLITNMGKQIKSLMKETKELNEDNETNGEEVIEIANESTSEETEVVRKSEVWLHCEMCVYKCKTETTMIKHVNSKHKGYKSCDICGTKCSSSESPKTHNSNAHKTQETVKCGNWMCMEETGSCGGFCVYDR